MLAALIVALSMTAVGFGAVGRASLTPFFLLLPLVTLISAARPIVACDGDMRRILNAFYIFIAAMLISIFSNLGSGKISSLLYSLVFVTYAWILVKNHRMLSRLQVEKILKAVILIYFATTVLTWIFTVSGVDTTSLEVFLKRVWDSKSGEFRYYGLSSEPSYAAFIVAICYLCLLRVSALRGTGKLIWLLIVVIQLSLFDSMYGYMLLFICLLAGFRGVAGGRAYSVVALAAAIFIAVAAGVLMMQNERMLSIVKSLSSFDLSTWFVLDSSSFMRIAPTVFYINSVDIFSWNFLFGHGAATSTGYYEAQLNMSADPSYTTLELGFLPAFLYDFGLIPAVLFMFLLKVIGGFRVVSLESAVVFLMLFNANFNTQLLWFVATALCISRIASFGCRNVLDPSSAKRFEANQQSVSIK